MNVLTVFSAVNVPESVALQVWQLLSAYDPDTYTRPCDEKGRAL